MVLVDSSVIIPLARTGKLLLLKKFFKKIKIGAGIKNELSSFDKTGITEIEKGLQSWIIEIRASKDIFGEAKILAEKEKISHADAELMLLAEKMNEKIITNDYKIHLLGRTKQVETIWLAAFLLECVKKKSLTKKQAKETLLELVQAGMYLKIEVYALIEKKIEEL